MTRRLCRGRAGFGLLVAVGVASALAGGAIQLGFAVAAIGGFGMLHGISDLSRVPRSRWVGFVLTYLLFAGVVIAAWRAWPAVALAMFLAAAAIHFGLEDAPPCRPAERVCHGLLLVAAPALLHAATLRSLFAALGVAPHETAVIVDAMRGAALLGLALLVPALLERVRDRAGGTRLALLTLGLLVSLPPLAGFAIAFVAAHAAPELAERMAADGHRHLFDHVTAHWPIALGAAAVLGGAGAMLADRVAPPLGLLFAGVAALALPHMTVTPLFASRPERGWALPRRAAPVQAASLRST